ncbi:MAG TPA: sigma-70 family RNA polymerase sigma factor [Planctomycetota bacterium]|nr:sigma-70 family RNA polymerase sigma factor [Planctomycetota bacterium]
MTTTDALVEAVKAGDVEQYGELVRQHQAAVRAFIATYCPNWETVDDLAQQTFIWAYEHFDEYTPGTRFSAWLKAIARNKILAELEEKKRDSGRRQKYVDFVQAVSGQCEVKEAEPEDEQDLSSALRQCMEKLPSDLRELLKERYQDDVAVRELAQRVKKTEAALKVTLFRIRQMLKRCVEQHQKFPVHVPLDQGL